MTAIALRAVRYRGLLATLTQRELKARYRGSALGFLWSLVNPLLLTAVYSVVFGWILAPGKGRGSVEPYALFLISGLFPWLWASTAILEGTVSLSASAGLIRKAVFPVELPPLVAVFANLAHFVFALPVLAAALVVGRVLGFSVGGWAVLWLPVVILLQIPMLCGAALAVSALNVLFKDVRDIVNNMMTVLFFLAPIIYSLSSIPHPWVARAVRLNPFTPFVQAYQAVLFHGVAPSVTLWLHMAVVSLLSWWIGSWIFERLRDTLVEMS
ncbi:MAG: ABC transporter permease [Acidobacteria bacterium]|nr:ABC transporter permease [Acidobacteriota bacterium]